MNSRHHPQRRVHRSFDAFRGAHDLFSYFATLKVPLKGELAIGVYNAWPDGYLKEGEISGPQSEILRKVVKSRDDWFC
ncbi:hypothetical protein [Bradyrhizobium sp. CCBAU 25360]|uniref:hypothetical protein n=1 Tax=Bradyrhizobium sp. CCBAU 25360 TaxID=858425 RepID=UPI0023066EDE|nr:hypothetical protein [Bradyrhizobium sp. CCBAU 25360]